MNRDEKPTRRIENWKLVGFLESRYIAPEDVKMILVGEVTMAGSKETVKTSEVLWFSHTSGIAETKNTLYNLGNPDPSWMQWIQEAGYALDHYSIEKV